MSKLQVVLTSLLAVFGLIAATPATAIELDGFTEPYRTISVAADESGIIAEMLVREGHVVEAGQPLVRLNSDVHLALLAIAEQSMQAQGRVEAASAEMRMRRERLAKLDSLRIGGHARQEEVDRARTEFAVAEANVRTAREDLATRRLEYEKLKAQLQRRTIRSPIAGAVTQLQKELGEFVAPNAPEILTLVQLDPLLANFSMMRVDAEKLRVGAKVKVGFPGLNRRMDGVIEFISPVTDAESGTVRVKVRVANADGQLRSGERCTIRISSK